MSQVPETLAEMAHVATKPSKKAPKSAESFNCQPCEYQTALKPNFVRHCCSIAHLTKCNLPLPPKKPTKKVRDALAAAEAAVAAEAAHQAELARVAEELRQREAEARALHAAELGRLEEELRLRDEERAIAAELAKPKSQIRKELWALQAAAKLAAKELERTDKAAFREKREISRAVERLQHKEDKKLEFFEKCKTQLADYVNAVCAEEVRDVQKMVNAPYTLSDYISSHRRVSDYRSPYYGYTPESHRAVMRKMGDEAAEKCAAEAIGSAGSSVIVEFETERGKKTLTRLTDFHSTFKPRPWLPEKENLRYTQFSFEGASYGAFFSPDTLRVYDYEVSIEIGRYDARHDITFVAGMPTPEVLEY